MLQKNNLMVKNNLEIHFFTIVLNGRPFIEQHIETFSSLSIKWHWHIIEGVADLKNDTSWSLKNGGAIPASLHLNGLSNDGTTDYIDELQKKYPNNISVYRKENGAFWNGKLEMINAPLKKIKKECLLWEIDVDEFWSRNQILETLSMFEENPNKYGAFYWCNFYVGPELVIATRFGYGNNPQFEWQRTWRYKPHFIWSSHEPPMLIERDYSGKIRPVIARGFFSHDETEARGLIFQHRAYVNEKQLEFKEIYYGYKDAKSQWNELQNCKKFPVKLSNFFSWVNDDTIVEKAASLGLPLLN
ncbi:glycosyltransferase family 2 protein [Polynucleobacter sp. TSB-Sco08W16]|uniref:glycosyltransferase family 2 protein n=1 Tax=Polynucleobacter sp. TSB-Sco08W16 TaxID=1758374 RepID=UPI001BFDA415|nr:glycosyltransferase family 2 protein [Polynucleobacter sp. TSB-Sco08W16]QWD74390.1 glycosyltransferase family 2 protein [Polynucleobacter sp. TSB-Sco08W16]